ncbi:MAG: ABC transporter permease [Propionibacteriaceae bacterium]|nr:ABC transporter permease [Propionibacteriaceae bacterium]
MTGRTQARAVAHWGLWSAYPGRVRPSHGAWRWVPATLSLVLVLAIWWGVTASGLVPSVVLPNPLDVVARVVAWALDGTGWRYLVPTLGAALIGSLIAMVVAIPMGVAIAHSRLLAAVFEPFVAFSQTVPLVAIAPLLALWIGYGVVPIAVLCAIISFFPMVTTTVIGIRGMDMRIIEHAWLDGAGPWQRLFHVELPIAAPAILAGVRAGFVLSMTGAIVGEFVMGGRGLGTLLTISREGADSVGVFAVLVWIVAAALVLQGSIQIAERASTRRLQGEQS